MKQLLIASLTITLLISATSCSTTRSTKEVDHTSSKTEPMRKKNQATDVNTPGNQADKVREKTR